MGAVVHKGGGERPRGGRGGVQGTLGPLGAKREGEVVDMGLRVHDGDCGEADGERDAVVKGVEEEHDVLCGELWGLGGYFYGNNLLWSEGGVVLTECGFRLTGSSTWQKLGYPPPVTNTGLKPVAVVVI